MKILVSYLNNIHFTNIKINILYYSVFDNI